MYRMFACALAGMSLCLAVAVTAAQATEFPVNPARFDPYKNFKFRVKWDGHFIDGVSKVSPLTRSTQVIDYREGGDASTVHRSTGITKFEKVTLERGLTQDTAFEAWADLVWKNGAPAGQEIALAAFRKDVVVDVYNEAGQLVTAYTLFRCWPSEYTALSDLDANVPGVLVQRLTLVCEGWDRDRSVVEPKEPGH